MRKLIWRSGAWLLLVLGSGQLHAQPFQIPPVGTDATFNVATWNIEHFGTQGPSSGDLETQFQNVLAVMEQANVHLWALQEMQTQQAFNNLVAALGDGWAGFWQADMTQFQIGYGFIYRTDIVQPLHVATILTQHSYDFAGRPPLLMRANLTFPEGTISNVRIINIHAKCCGGFEDWQRRVNASQALKNYVDNLLAVNLRVLVLGDFNDRLRSSITQNQLSPYANFRIDVERYHFGTLSLEDANIYTWCGNASCTFGSTIDHILITAPLFDDYVEDSTDRYDALLENIPNYRSSTSDHVAVYARFDFFEPIGTEGSGELARVMLEQPYPNPFSAGSTLTFTLPEAAHVDIDVFDALGRRVAVLGDQVFAAGMHERVLSGEGLAPGLYVVQLTASAGGRAETSTRRILRAP